MSRRKTPWFGGDTKPAHIGVYERKPSEQTGWDGRYSFFDGAEWCVSAATVYGAENIASSGPSGAQDRPWRGLAEAPR